MERRRLDKEITSRGSKKPQLDVVLGGQAPRFDRLLEMIANCQFAEARAEMDAMKNGVSR